MSGKRKFIFGGIIIFLAIGYLCFVGFTNSATYYYTVSEVIEQETSLDGANMRVNGQVAANSIEREEGGLTLGFTITEGSESLHVVYQGTVPDSFAEGIDVVVEGHLDSEGIFQADNILTKCPSKYVPEE